jgi:CRISPR-associated protein (TIGR02584 family)
VENKKILLCITGLSPQVVTETLYALCVSQNSSDLWKPDEVHVITTSEGAERIKLTLLHPKTGKFHHFIAEYNLSGIQFNEDNIHVISDKNNKPMTDIRTVSDNEAAADYMTEKMYFYTQDAESELHVSMAGGRKTMGFYAAYGLSIYGRRQDRLSHVLVSSPFEGHTEFYYPTRESYVIYQRNEKDKPLDTKNAEVTLADIPFVRLTEGRNVQLQQGRVSYLEAVQQAQEDISALELVVDTANETLHLHRESIKLPSSLFAFYWLFAERQKADIKGLHWSDDCFATDYLNYYGKLVKLNSAFYEKTELELNSSTETNQKFFETKKSKIKSQIIDQLGERIAQPYLIAKVLEKKGGYAQFGLTLNQKQITIK